MQHLQWSLGLLDNITAISAALVRATPRQDTASSLGQIVPSARNHMAQQRSDWRKLVAGGCSHTATP